MQTTSEQKEVRQLFDQLHDAALHSFPSTRNPAVPEDQGVYVIYNEAKKVLHVGKTSRAKRGLYQRLGNHLSGGSSFRDK